MMKLIEVAYERGWCNLCLKYDSTLVVTNYAIRLVSWRFRNRWRNCIFITNWMNFLTSHIYWEGNSCADKLANYSNTSHYFN